METVIQRAAEERAQPGACTVREHAQPGACTAGSMHSREHAHSVQSTEASIRFNISYLQRTEVCI